MRMMSAYIAAHIKALKRLRLPRKVLLLRADSRVADEAFCGFL